ncbi:hypothetical protein GCM10027285_10840 [Oleiagrimonas citrea]|uniref:Uncharacterized protein n=1 Tax=Oleiagrimonas citrea TaxID=1665687 RepID=A0A846ZJ96_9GAMM|nr:hypothetical protein [Oleiagrimonas citrea]NKZ38355.1 hypothetical protein [Oleiagrimonas citrea]
MKNGQHFQRFLHLLEVCEHNADRWDYSRLKLPGESVSDYDKKRAQAFARQARAQMQLAQLFEELDNEQQLSRRAGWFLERFALKEIQRARVRGFIHPDRKAAARAWAFAHVLSAFDLAARLRWRRCSAEREDLPDDLDAETLDAGKDWRDGDA